jgi:hypothetical protein
MNQRLCLPTLTAFFVIALAAAQDSSASFHLMQIEQALGGVCGDTTSQAIQLRMRAGGQNLVSGSQLIAYDAAGLNPVTLIVFPSNVSFSTAGSRILVTSAQFASDNPTPSANFTMTNLIPASYLAAGRLAFLSPSPGNLVYWSLSWGGAAYTGSTSGQPDNDDGTDFGPSFPGSLPTTGQGLLFQGPFGADSTSNAADYAVTSQEALMTNNSGSSGTVMDCFLFADGFESGDTTSWSSTVP